ncbi:MAG: hypothetical protein JSV18_06005 [Candidatus Bathyarchaeota archaeon]|nr:MAG: hypothetical protein JSV18_06005 [Candidatus Bathyarchaeota archaeon]
MHVRDHGKRKPKLHTSPWNAAMMKVCTDTSFIPEAYLRKDYLDENLILYSIITEE